MCSTRSRRSRHGLNRVNFKFLLISNKNPHKQVCTAYTDSETGEEIKFMPANIKKLAKCRPVLKTFQGWDQDTTQCKSVRCWFCCSSSLTDLFSGLIFPSWRVTMSVISNASLPFPSDGLASAPSASRSSSARSSWLRRMLAPISCDFLFPLFSFFASLPYILHNSRPNTEEDDFKPHNATVPRYIYKPALCQHTALDQHTTPEYFIELLLTRFFSIQIKKDKKTQTVSSRHIHWQYWIGHQ